MLSRLLIVLAAFLSGTFGLLPAARAAESAAGVITGRVSNAATGAYLQRARVAVRESGTLTFTDDTGAYRLGGIGSGPVTVEIFYTGLDPLTVTVNVPPGGAIERNFALSSAARYGVQVHGAARRFPCRHRPRDRRGGYRDQRAALLSKP